MCIFRYRYSTTLAASHIHGRKVRVHEDTHASTAVANGSCEQISGVMSLARILVYLVEVIFYVLTVMVWLHGRLV